MSTEEISIRLTGLPLDVALAKAAKFIDGIMETKEAEFRIDMQHDGYDAGDVEKILDGQRPVVAAARAELLAAVAASFDEDAVEKMFLDVPSGARH